MKDLHIALQVEGDYPTAGLAMDQQPDRSASSKLREMRFPNPQAALIDVDDRHVIHINGSPIVGNWDYCTEVGKYLATRGFRLSVVRWDPGMPRRKEAPLFEYHE